MPDAGRLRDEACALEQEKIATYFEEPFPSTKDNMPFLPVQVKNV
jgi:hypothetical protein